MAGAGQLELCNGQARVQGSANNFGHQEPGTKAEIKQFCTANYDVTFPMMAKISVKGPTRRRSTIPDREHGDFAGRSAGTSPSSWSIATATSSPASPRQTTPTPGCVAEIEKALAAKTN